MTRAPVQCSTCGKPIRDIGLAIVVWKWPDFAGLAIRHKGECDLDDGRDQSQELAAFRHADARERLLRHLIDHGVSTVGAHLAINTVAAAAHAVARDPNRLNAEENAMLWKLVEQHGVTAIARRLRVATRTLDHALLWNGVRGLTMRPAVVARIRGALENVVPIRRVA